MIETPARHARRGVFGYFGLCGLVIGTWSASLPAIDDRLDLGSGRIGTVLLLVSFGVLASMQLAGWMADRWSSRRLCLIAGPVHATLLLPLALAGSYPFLLAGAVAFGLGFGLLELGMNAHAVEVERSYARPIMSAFHGMWSLGGAAGGIATAAALRAGLSVTALLTCTAIVAAALFALPGRMLLAKSPNAPAPPATIDPPPPHPGAEQANAQTTDAHTADAHTVQGRADGAGGRGGGRVAGVGWEGLGGAGARRAILLLGIVTFAAAISEGAAMDWAAIHARQVLDAGPGLAPLAFTVYSVAMTATRFLGDRLRGQLGAARTLRLAGVLAAAGYALILLAPAVDAVSLACAWAGWAMVGCGVATVVPVVLSSAGAGPAATGRALAMMNTFGWCGLLSGPAIIGHLADATSLPAALTLPGVLAVFVAVTGPGAIRAVIAGGSAETGSARATLAAADAGAPDRASQR